MNKNPSFSVIPPWFKPQLLQGMKRGIEKESLRMQADGHLSKQPHPKNLGSALTHPFITTDYSEALLELITPPLDSPQQMLDFMRELHWQVYDNLPEGERLWPLSMPCMLGDHDDDIPLAQYGTSHIGRLKTLYRRGLGVRYGRRMQTIAGIHYNLSFPKPLFAVWQQFEMGQRDDESLQAWMNDKYLGLTRNVQRLLPLIITITGASPAVCACFLTGREHHLQAMNHTTYFLPYATSLRMGRLGYQNSAQQHLGIHYNNFGEYVDALQAATRMEFEPFSRLGLDDEQGEPLQINANILQIENEYYSSIRPKQPAQRGETPSQALIRGGIDYIELRCLDLNPFSAIGIDATTAYFVECFLLYALLLPSPAISTTEEELIATNQSRVVDMGRDEQVMMVTLQGEIALQTWMEQHFEQMLVVADQLDCAYEMTSYRAAVTEMYGKLKNKEQLPAYQVNAGAAQTGSIWQFGAALAQQYASELKAQSYDHTVARHIAEQSIAQQQALEDADKTIPFARFLQTYRS